MTTQKRLATLFFLLAVFHSIAWSHCELADEQIGKKKYCANLTATFSNVIYEFNDCAIENAEPVTYCWRCGNPFAAVIHAYTGLIDNEICKVKYFDQDRLNIIEIIYTNAVSLWEAGSCSTCYDWVDPSHGNSYGNKSRTATEFFDDLKEFKMCIGNANKNSTVCERCIGHYNKVNDLYNTIKESSEDKFCFDIKDAMNKTRLEWSRDLNCCKDRKSSLTAFIVISVIISGVIPFAFYTGFMFFGWRREQQHEPLLDSDPQPSGSGSGNGQIVEPIVELPIVSNLLDLHT